MVNLPLQRDDRKGIGAVTELVDASYNNEVRTSIPLPNDTQFLRQLIHM
jgi:hypothetical protein